MKMPVRYLSVLALFLSIIGMSAGTCLADKNGCGEEMTTAMIAQRALDMQEIQNVMGIHALYGAPGGDHDKAIELIWA